MSYKRAYDLTLVCIAGALLLPIWLPVSAAVALAIFLTMGRPIFYVQDRLAKGGRVFRIIKFRTMVRDAERDTGPIWVQADDARVTRLGRILRRSGIDEAPQVINILKGEMSLVGPRPERPELAEQFERETPAFRERLSVPPGLASLDFVRMRGNNQIAPRQRLRYDLFYIRHMSPCFDSFLVLSAVYIAFSGLFRRSWRR